MNQKKLGIRTGRADGVPLNEWTDDFLVPRPSWVDIVEDFVPLP